MAKQSLIPWTSLTILVNYHFMTLSVHVKKTTYLTFKPWLKQCNHNFSISLGDQLLTQTNADHKMWCIEGSILGPIFHTLHKWSPKCFRIGRASGLCWRHEYILFSLQPKYLEIFASLVSMLQIIAEFKEDNLSPQLFYLPLWSTFNSKQHY